MALPRAGVYVTKATIDGVETHPSVSSLGTNPTFQHDRKLRLETLLLDFSGDLYGRHLAIDFLERIRGQRAFPDAEMLAQRIREDVRFSLSFHSQRPIGT
jgi:riboflavin kinase/FMN adenylyltransferase